MALLDLLGRRWSLRVIWELGQDAATFRDLQARCEGMSSSVLSQRLAELRAAGIARQGEHGYELTGEGRELLGIYPALHAWAGRWAQRGAGAAGDGP